jgi:hypothetical protein
LERHGACDPAAMCANRKRFVTAVSGIVAAALSTGPVLAGGAASAGSVAIGESQGGITDRAYVSAPPDWSYVVEREPGSFLDCGEGMDASSTDRDGRDLAALRCGVTLTETMVIPTAAASARIVVHF